MHTVLAFYWVKLLYAPALKTGHEHAGSLHIQLAHPCGTGHHSFLCCPEHTSVDHAESANLFQTPFRHYLPATLSSPSERLTFQIFISIPICCCSTAGLYANRVYATNIFLQFKCLIQPFICCQQNIKACKVLEPDKTVWKDEDYNYCHRCPTKPALRCFSSLCLSPNVTSCKVKLKCWDHCWSSLTTFCILSYF